MHKSRVFFVAGALLLAAGTPAVAQMIGQVGANAGQSPQDAREMDQTFDELKNKGALEDQKAVAEKELKIGSDLVKQSKFAEAIPHLEIALEKRPNDVTTLIYLGFCHRMLGSTMTGPAKLDQYSRALDCYRRAQAIDPDNKLLHEYTGKVLLLLHDVPAAQVELKALRKLCPNGCDELRALEAVVPEPKA